MGEILESGERINLRAVREDDVRRARAWLEDPEIHSALTMPFLVGNLREGDWLASLRGSGDAVHLAIVLRHGGAHIGNCGFHGLGRAPSEAEFGILLGEKHLWGKGYGTEAACLALRYAFGQLGLERVSLRVALVNERARRLYQRVGFVRETRPSGVFSCSRREAMMAMSIDRKRWKEVLRAAARDRIGPPRGPSARTL